MLLDALGDYKVERPWNWFSFVANEFFISTRASYSHSPPNDIFCVFDWLGLKQVVFPIKSLSLRVYWSFIVVAVFSNFGEFLLIGEFFALD